MESSAVRPACSSQVTVLASVWTSEEATFTSRFVTNEAVAEMALSSPVAVSTGTTRVALSEPSSCTTAVATFTVPGLPSESGA